MGASARRTNASKLRLDYAIADYGRGEIRRLTLGSFVAF